MELFTAMLLLNHAVTTKSNVFSVIPITEADLLEKTSAIAFCTGSCTLHNFINHSCHPSIRFFMRNREHVLMTTQPIKKGKQVSTSKAKPYSGCKYVRMTSLVDLDGAVYSAVK